MEAVTVIILALLGIVGGRNILLSKEEGHLQVINREQSRDPALCVTPGDQLATLDVQYPGQQSNENFINNKILELIFKDFDPAAINETLVIHNNETAEAKADDGSSVKVSEGDNKMDNNTVFEDRALSGDYCFNGTRVGESCWPDD